MRLSATRVSAGASTGGPSLETRALAAIRRSGGWLYGIPASGAGVFTDSAGTIPATAVGDVLGHVNDRVGINHATQATQASKPIIGTLANGRRAVRFDGANDFLSLPTGAIFNPHADHWTVAAVIHNSPGGGVIQVVSGSSNSGNSNSIACQLFVSSNPQLPRGLWRSDSGALVQFDSTSAMVAGTPYVLTLQRNSNMGVFRVNGVQQGALQALPTSGITVNTANIGISVRTTQVFPLNGFAVVAGGNGTLQNTDRAVIEQYLAQQVGASLGG